MVQNFVQLYKGSQIIVIFKRYLQIYYKSKVLFFEIIAIKFGNLKKYNFLCAMKRNRKFI